MKLPQDLITEIASELECGMLCFYHIPTGTLESHPDPDDPYFDPEPWQDIMDKIESDRDNYIRIEKMNSHEAYEVMENFAFSLSDTDFKDRIFDRLSKRKPFQNFKHLVENSKYRQAWFDFRTQAYVKWVKRQLH
jgi:hypothetical protein